MWTSKNRGRYDRSSPRKADANRDPASRRYPRPIAQMNSNARVARPCSHCCQLWAAAPFNPLITAGTQANNFGFVSQNRGWRMADQCQCVN